VEEHIGPELPDIALDHRVGYEPQVSLKTGLRQRVENSQERLERKNSGAGDQQGLNRGWNEAAPLEPITVAARKRAHARQSKDLAR